MAAHGLYQEVTFLSLLPFLTFSRYEASFCLEDHYDLPYEGEAVGPHGQRDHCSGQEDCLLDGPPEVTFDQIEFSDSDLRIPAS